jgi:hypothetical protein
MGTALENRQGTRDRLYGDSMSLELYVDELTHYVSWLKKAKESASRLTQMLQNFKNRDEFEQAIVFIHRVLLARLLESGTKSELPVGLQSDLETLYKKISRVRDDDLHRAVEKGATTLSSKGICVAVGASFRTSHVANARVSSYGFSIPMVSEFHKRSGLNEDSLEAQGEKFFSELLNLYFAVFGRGNTLNEHLLDCVEIKGFVWRNCKIMCVYFEDNLQYKMDNLSWIGLDPPQGADDVGILRVAYPVWRDLTNNGTLSGEFWKLAWESYSNVVLNGAGGAQKVHRDWAQVAMRRITSSQPSLMKRLSEARRKTEDKVFVVSNKNLIECLKGLYPEKHTTLTEKLKRLLLMLQGSLSLVPWAKNDKGTPLPVVTIPAIGNKFFCAWTIIPKSLPCPIKEWSQIQPIIKDLFKDASSVDESLSREESGFNWPLEKGESTPEAVQVKKIRESLSTLGRRFPELIEVGQHLTGDAHEGKETSYCFLYGAPEVLKYVEQVVSDERLSGAETVHNAESFRLRCQAHYSLFQQEGVVAFIDQFHGALTVEKMVALRLPSDEDLSQMRGHKKEEHYVLDDQYRALRWVTWKVNTDGKGKVAAVLAGGDGVLRVFWKGKLILAWKKRAGPGEPRWRVGIEFGTRNKSPIGELSNQIARALGMESRSSSVQDLVSTICLISNTVGVGAVIIIGKSQQNDHSLCDMVPDDFKMQWARDRRLSSVEQRMLYSLAIMDGAVYIATDSHDPWVYARRYIAAAPQLLNDQVLTATRLVEEYFDKKWISHIGGCGDIIGCTHMRIRKSERRLLCEDLKAWKDKIGSKGTRHRSVLQLCCLWNDKLTTKENSPLVCSISADGPVHLYQIRACECKQHYLWTKTIIS